MLACVQNVGSLLVTQCPSGIPSGLWELKYDLWDESDHSYAYSGWIEKMPRGGTWETATHQICAELAAVAARPYQCELWRGKILSMPLAQWELSNEAEHDRAKHAVSQTLQTLLAGVARS